MRYLVLSDLHANFQALEAVLATAPPRSYDSFLVLGDLVGYGADPNVVIEQIRELRPNLVIRGNHDKVASGLLAPETFNPAARHAVTWTIEALDATNREYLRTLPAGPVLLDENVELWHGAPDDEDFYIFTLEDAEHAVDLLRRPLGLFGHTHVQGVYRLPDETNGVRYVRPDVSGRIALPANGRILINPGSVGQPRDGDPRAAFAIVDTDAHVVELRRVPYPVAVAQARILEAGLPLSLATRLAVGR
ncbi:MAG: metallophosphoesterase [Luteitalea sp.]|nr:metallophosphoesterase [Luteitalea sp.]